MKTTTQDAVTASRRFTVIGAALLALFLGALDALVISAAMPTVVADLGGMHLYSWVYSAYFLARAVSLPIFALFAFAPLFIQGVQGQSPMQVGMAMLSLSLGWSVGALLMGQVIDRLGFRICAVSGALCLIFGCVMTLLFNARTSPLFGFTIFFIIGVGMGMVSLSTLLVVQNGLEAKDMGVATSSNQFGRTLGGAVGVGVCGGFIANRFDELTKAVQQSGMVNRLPQSLSEKGLEQMEQLFQPEIQALLPPELKTMVHDAVSRGIREVFWTVVIAAILCLFVTLLIPSDSRGAKR